MESLIQSIKQAAVGRESDAGEYQLFDLTCANDRALLEQLLRQNPPRFVHDQIADQLGEFLEVSDPSHKVKGAERDVRIREHLRGGRIENYGIWVFFPWSSSLVHVLPREQFRAVRTARNRYKITQPEQDALFTKRIGIVGLSVGNSAAVTLALEGIGGKFKVSDFDHLSLSNVNRLRSGAADIGVNKTLLAAREMYEIDPYLEIERFPEGINTGNMDAFLLGGGKLDLLVEECDDLYVKIVIRERCRELGIPVIMDTSDRGMLDIERFDLEPARPILHGLIGDVRAESLRGLPTKDKVPIFLAIVGGHRMSTRMAASLPEIDHSIGSWPQLASGVALGGAITADAARRLLLGEFKQSGRWYVDIESIVRDGTGEMRTAAPAPKPEEVSPEALRARSAGPMPPVKGVVTPEVVRWIVSNAILAPSAHNGQPWTFVWRNGALECRHDPAHDLPSLDYDRCATWATFGAVAENIEIAANAIALKSNICLFPSQQDERLVFAVKFAFGEPQSTELLDLIAKRCTNRRRGVRSDIDSSAAAALGEAAKSADARLQLVCDQERLRELGALMGACDRVSYMNPAIYREVMNGFRWTRKEVERCRDGLDISTMELTPAERAGFWLLSKWEIMDALKGFGGGLALEDLAKKCIEASSAVGLLTTSGTTPADYFRGGRALQRLWLEATRRGLSLQPWTGLPYLFARAERGGGAGLSKCEMGELQLLRERYRAIFNINADDAEVLLFRLGYADPPTAISLRRPVDTVLNFA